jgi:hypothetical protein
LSPKSSPTTEQIDGEWHPLNTHCGAIRTPVLMNFSIDKCIYLIRISSLVENNKMSESIAISSDVRIPPHIDRD